jgi:hypothetical protein
MPKLEAFVVGRFQYINVGQITESTELYFPCCFVFLYE